MTGLKKLSFEIIGIEEYAFIRCFNVESNLDNSWAGFHDKSGKWLKILRKINFNQRF